MVTLNQLKKENERLKKAQRKIVQMQRTNDERTELLKQNKRLSREIKHGKAMRVGKAVSRDLAKVGKVTGKGLVKTGKGTLKGLQRYAIFLAEQERKQKATNRRLKSVKKKTKTRRR